MQSILPLNRSDADVDLLTRATVGQAKLATQLAFFIAGFALACWAPMVPYAKTRLDVGHAELGTVLLFLGMGSVLGMPAAGMVAKRWEPASS